MAAAPFSSGFGFDDAVDSGGMWESMLSTIVGGVVAAGAGGLTAFVQARQASRLRGQQQKHEDQYRLHQDRVPAYIAFRALAGKARGTLQDLTGDTPEGDAKRRDARNETHLAGIKIALIGGAEVVAAARRVMIHIDAITYGRDTFDTDAWSEVLAVFEEAARYDPTGLRDLASLMAVAAWPAPPPRPAATRSIGAVARPLRWSICVR